MSELSSQNQLGLVRDILNTHYGDGEATLSEYEQLYRTTNVIMTSGDSADYNEIIKAINGYSEIGMKLDGFEEHVSNNRDNLSTWIQQLQ